MASWNYNFENYHWIKQTLYSSDGKIACLIIIIITIIIIGLYSLMTDDTKNVHA